MEVNLPFLLFVALYLRAIEYKPLRGFWRGDLTDGFFHLRFEGLIFGGAYTSRGLYMEFYGILSYF